MNEDIISNLTQLGFSAYEAKVYLALLKASPATGYQISKNSGVPRSMVYQALSRLENKGAVLKANQQKGALYRPTSPSLLLEKVESDHSSIVESLKTSFKSLSPHSDEDLIWNILGDDNIYFQLNSIITDAKEEIYLVLDDQGLIKAKEILEIKNNDGVNIGVLLTGTSDFNFGEVAKHPPEESESHGLHDMLVVVADRAKVLIVSKNSDGVLNGTITTNTNLVQITRQFVWMELFTQRINAKLGSRLIKRLSSQDQEILRSYSK